jgi:hypothetical protein
MKGACRDRSWHDNEKEESTQTREEEEEEEEEPPQQHTTLLDLAKAPAESLTHALHSHLETWEPLPLSHSLVTPTTSTSA